MDQRSQKLGALFSRSKTAAKLGKEYQAAAEERALSMVDEKGRKELTKSWAKRDAAESAAAEEEAAEKAAKRLASKIRGRQLVVTGKNLEAAPLTREDKRVFEGMESKRVGLSDDEKKAIEEQKRSLEQLLDTYKKDPTTPREKIRMLESQIAALTNPTGRGRRTRKHRRRHSKRRHTKRRR